MGTLMTVFQETWAPLVTPFSIVTVIGHMQQPWPETTVLIEVADPGGMTVWPTPPGFPPRPAEGTAEDERNLRWTLEEGEDER